MLKLKTKRPFRWKPSSGVMISRKLSRSSGSGHKIGSCYWIIAFFWVKVYNVVFQPSHTGWSIRLYTTCNWHQKIFFVTVQPPYTKLQLSIWWQQNVVYNQRKMSQPSIWAAPSPIHYFERSPRLVSGLVLRSHPRPHWNQVRATPINKSQKYKSQGSLKRMYGAGCCPYTWLGHLCILPVSNGAQKITPKSPKWFLCYWIGSLTPLTLLSLLKVKISAPLFLIGDFFVPPLTTAATPPPPGGVPRGRPEESLEPRRVDSVPAEGGVLHLRIGAISVIMKLLDWLLKIIIWVLKRNF